MEKKLQCINSLHLCRRRNSGELYFFVNKKNSKENARHDFFPPMNMEIATNFEAIKLV